MYRSELV